MEEQRSDKKKENFAKAGDFHPDSPGFKAAETRPPRNRSAGPEKTEALSHVEFPKCRAGPTWAADLFLLRLRFGSAGGRICSPRILGSREVAGYLILADVENDHFVRSHARAPHIKLHGFAGGLVLFFDSAIIHENGYRVLGSFLVGFGEVHLDRSNPLRSLGSFQREFVIVAVAAALQLLQVVAIVGDEAAHDAQVACGAVEFALCRLQIALGGFDIFLGAAYFGSHRADLFFALLLDLRQLCREF